MRKLKIGDRIRCIDNTHVENFLTLGKIYTVTHTSEDPSSVSVYCDTERIGGFCLHRFKLVEDMIKLRRKLLL